MIQERVGLALRPNGFPVLSAGSPDDLGAGGVVEERSVPLTEPLEGPDAAFLRSVTKLQPAMIIFDLNSSQIPWDRWIHVLKTSSATRRIPLLAFGPHVEEGRLSLARERGAESALPRGKFLNNIAEVVKERAARDSTQELGRACNGELSEAARKGVELHDAGEFFEAHEELERAWIDAPELEGYLYRALLQITVACLHIQRGNPRGARKMLLRIRQWLDPLPSTCRGIDTGQLKAYAQELREALASPSGGTGPALLRPFPRTNTKD